MVSVDVLDNNNGCIIDITNKDDASINDRKTANCIRVDQETCRVCGGPCTTRCSLCKLVYYCSVDCQRVDWTKGGHKMSCTGGKDQQLHQRQRRRRQRQRRAAATTTTTTTNPPMGPSIPPPTSVRNEHDAKRVVQELWSMASEDAVAKAAEATQQSTSPNRKQQPSAVHGNKAQTTPKQTTPTATTSKPESESETTTQGVIDHHEQNQQREGEDSSAPSTAVDGLLPEHNQTTTFVVEEMPQICRFQLTLTTRTTKEERIKDTSIAVSAEPLGRSRARTLVIVRENESIAGANINNNTLFAGEFPRPIQACEITWRVVTNKRTKKNDDDDDDDDATSKVVDIVFRLPYPYDPSNTSSLALGGSLDHSYYGSSSSDSTLDEINNVVCGACHLPLILPQPRAAPNSRNNTIINNNTADSTTGANSKTISRVFPLPQGHWDEIADYLICYDGQPVVDFAAGSECAKPSIVLQDASLLCFHRKDVERAVCALAVDGYGELTENGNRDNSDDDLSKSMYESSSHANSGASNDLGTFVTKLPSSSFVLPNSGSSRSGGPSAEPVGASSDTAGTEEEKKDDPDKPMDTSNSNNSNNIEPPISATSAVIRGDRTWQDAVDADSVSLCCARCCSPLGFASLGSPETWRFWKHRLSIPLHANTNTNLNTNSNNAIEEKDDRGGSNNIASAVSFARNTAAAATATKRTLQKAALTTTVLPVTKPLGSCSSFLARELVRYAESKAIFTFVVRREGPDEQQQQQHKNSRVNTNGDKCLLLRMLSWETALATSFEESTHHPPLPSKPKESSFRLRFRKVAKIVFEVTDDPIAAKKEGPTHGGDGKDVPTQWFWGGVDLCCPPNNNNNNNASNNIPTATDTPPPDTVSTARLQLPSDEYDVVLEDLVSGKALFEPEIANATILLKMGGISEGLGLTAVALE